jgi:hypothetical protein
MPLLVETGAGAAGANSFASVADADLWYSGLLDSEWTALSVGQKERALILASSYVSNQQVYPFSGTKLFLGNALAWPRTNALRWEGGTPPASTEIPVEVKQATIVAASLAAKGFLPTQVASAADPTAREIKRERIEGAVTIDYFHSSEGTPGAALDTAAGPGVMARYGVPDVTGLLLPLLREDLVLGIKSTVVGRTQAARRGALYQPDQTPAAFSRGMFDRHSLDEDRVYGARGQDRGD